MGNTVRVVNYGIHALAVSAGCSPLTLQGRLPPRKYPVKKVFEPSSW